MNNLEAIVNRFPSAKVAVFGDVMLDKFTYGTVNRVSPEAPVPVVDIAYSEDRLGGCGNVASNLAAFGSSVLLFGVIGHDKEAASIEEILKAQKITSRLLKTKRPTTTKHRIIAHKQQIVRVDAESRAPISNEDEEEVLKMARSAAKDVAIFILSDYAKGFLTDKLCQDIIKIAHEMGKPVIVDPKAPFSKYSGASMITPNFEEFRRYGNASADRDPAAMAIHAARMMRDFRIGRLLVTMGEHGMVLFENGRFVKVDALKNGYDVIDITGAGDTAIAAFALAIASGADHSQAMRLANFAAGVVVTKFGTATCSPGELTSILRSDDSHTEVVL